MADLPDQIQRTLAKGIAAYVRATAATELPPAVAALKKTVQTPKGLARNRDRLLAVLDDDPLRARVLEWLEEGKPALSKSEAAALKLAAERPEGWIDRLERVAPRASAKEKPAKDVRDLEQKLEREKEAHRRAREEVKRVKEAGRLATKAERDRSLRLDEEVSKLLDAIRERDSDLQAERAALARATKEVDRLKRKLRSDVDSARNQLRRLRDENRELKAKLTQLERAAKASGKKNPKARTSTKKTSSRRGPRPVLDVPKGRLADAPETLEEWLRAPGVCLLVDGYNVTRSEAGYGHLSLEQQRDRLRAELKSLANRMKVPTTLVWDGAEVAPGTKRLSSGFFAEEYSAPDRTGNDKDRADRHIVALLKKMPPDPVVLATNDRALQDQAAAERATIATSSQLLALLH